MLMQLEMKQNYMKAPTLITVLLRLPLYLSRWLHVKVSILLLLPGISLLSLLRKQSLYSQEMNPGPSNQSGLRFISGIINKDKLLRFERMLFRATRGNMLFNQTTSDEEIMDPSTSEMVSIISYLSDHMLIQWDAYLLTGFVLVGGESCICGILFWGASEDKNIENMWSIWCKLLSCPWGYNKAEAAY